MGGVPWSEQELMTLKQLYPVAHWNELNAAFRQRTKASVQVKAIELGIARTKNAKTPWTGAEKLMLRNLYDRSSWDEICAAIPRHARPAIAKMANTMSLRRDTAQRSPYPIIRELRAQRRALDIEQQVLAKILGSHKVQIAKWERGELVPRLRTFFDWVEALGFRLELHQVS